MPQYIEYGTETAAPGAVCIGARNSPANLFAASIMGVLDTLTPNVKLFAFPDAPGLVTQQSPLVMLDAYSCQTSLTATDAFVSLSALPAGPMGFNLPTQDWLNCPAPIGGPNGYFIAVAGYWNGLRSGQSVADVLAHSSGAGPTQLQLFNGGATLAQGATSCSVTGVSSVGANLPFVVWGSCDGAGGLALGVNSVNVGATATSATLSAGAGPFSIGGGLTDMAHSMAGLIGCAVVLDSKLHTSPLAAQRAALITALAAYYGVTLS